MKKLLLVICLGIGLSSSLLAGGGNPNYAVTKIPEHLIEDAGAVLRIQETYFEVISEGQAKLTRKWAYTILNEKTEELSIAYAHYDELSSVEYIKGVLYDAYGNEIRKLKKSDIEDRSVGSNGVYDDNRVKVAKLIHTRYPYTVEFEVEQTLKNLLVYPRWIPQIGSVVAVQSSIFSVSMPLNLKLRYRELNLPSQKSEQGTATGKASSAERNSDQVLKKIINGRMLYTWQLNDYPAVKKREPFSPDWRERIPAVFLAPSKFEVDGYEGDLSTWKSYGEWLNLLNAGRDKISEETQDKIKQLVADSPNKTDKIRKVYEYVQQKTRYVSIQLGIGGWQPFPASTVDSKGYGDCKALTNYTQALLKTVGINSYYTIVKAGANELPILKDFPSTQFNHVFLCVPLPSEKDTIWLECTSQTQAFGYIGDFTGNRDVLLVTPEGGKLVHTPVYDKSSNQEIRNATVDLNSSGAAKAQILSQYQALEEGNRGFVVEYGPEDQKKWLYDRIKIPSFQINDFSMSRIKDRIPKTIEKLNLSIPKCASISGTRLFLTANLMNRWTYIPKTVENRRSDVVLDPSYDGLEIDTIVYNLPEGYQTEYIPETIQIEDQFGKYSAHFFMEGNQFTYIRRFEMNAGRYPRESYKDLIKFFKAIAKADKSKLVLVKK